MRPEKVRGWELLRQSAGRRVTVWSVYQRRVAIALTLRGGKCDVPMTLRVSDLPPQGDLKNEEEKQRLVKIEQRCARRNAAHWPINCDTRSVKSVTDAPSFWRSLNKEIGHPMRQKKLLKFFSSYPVSMYICIYRYTSFVPFYFSSPVIHPCFRVASLQVLWLIGNCNLSAGVKCDFKWLFSSWQPCDAVYC